MMNEHCHVSDSGKLVSDDTCDCYAILGSFVCFVAHWESFVAQFIYVRT